jgi:hypothetical protein
MPLDATEGKRVVIANGVADRVSVSVCMCQSELRCFTYWAL